MGDDLAKRFHENQLFSRIQGRQKKLAVISSICQDFDNMTYPIMDAGDSANKDEKGPLLVSGSFLTTSLTIMPKEYGLTWKSPISLWKIAIMITEGKGKRRQTLYSETRIF